MAHLFVYVQPILKMKQKSEMACVSKFPVTTWVKFHTQRKLRTMDMTCFGYCLNIYNQDEFRKFDSDAIN